MEISDIWYVRTVDQEQEVEVEANPPAEPQAIPSFSLEQSCWATLKLIDSVVWHHMTTSKKEQQDAYFFKVG